MDKHIRRITILLALALAVLVPLVAMAQVTATGEIHGVVKDPSGAVVPGAQIQLKDQATGITKEAKSGAEGTFEFFNLAFGKYQLKVTAPGFQTALYNDVVVDAGRKADVPVNLAIGQPSETVTVEAAGVRLETTSNQVAMTIPNTYIQELPLQNRDVLQFALLMPGSTGSGGTATFNGLPNASMNITLDGMNNNSQRFKSGGTSFYEFAPTRLDSIEEVTISTTGTGADAAGGGAMSVAFVTRRGTSNYHGKVFDQWANTDLNANSFVNNYRKPYIPRPILNQHDWGGDAGGPLKIPFVPYFKDKLFFFANFEAMPRPSTSTYTTSYLISQAQQGTYTYFGIDNQNHTINVLQLAGQNGYASKIDPTVQNILSQINATQANATPQPMTTSDLNHQTYQWPYADGYHEYFPTARLDYQINKNLHWNGAWNMRWQYNDGLPSYPGLSQVYGSYWIETQVVSNGLDWTIKPNMVLASNFGIQDNWEVFYQEDNIHLWDSQGARRIYLESGVGDLIPNYTPWNRNNPVYSLKEDLNWVKGKHTIQLGGLLTRTSFWEESWGDAGVLNEDLALDSADPVQSVFSTTTMPFVRTNASDIANAAQLYATLTGRIGSIWSSRNVDEVSHQYQNWSPLMQRFARTSLGIYAQDSFHARPDLTVNFGLRWEFSGAIHNTNGIDATPDIANLMGPSAELFHPGKLDGVLNPQLNLTPYTYHGDKVNPAPTLGFAWSPTGGKGLMRKLFGGKTVIRSSFAIDYYDEGLNTVSNTLSSNPGSGQSMWLYPGMTGFNSGGLTLQSSVPALSVFPDKFSFPMPESWFYPVYLSTTMPELKTPYVQNWTFGIQREIAKGNVLEIRYVGNRAVHMWHNYDLQETNIFENGFLNDFKNAQNNLAIDTANGFKNDFSNHNLPGEVATPIFDAAFGAIGSTPALSLSQGYKSSSFITNLTQGTAASMANSMANSITYFCHLVGSNFSPCGFDAAGHYAMNFFRPNPYASDIYVLDDNGDSWYHALQVDLRRSFSKGLQLNANYTFSKALGDMNNSSDQTATAQPRTLRDHKLDILPLFNDRRQTLRVFGTYELPMGPGRFLSVENGFINRVIGGWTVSLNFQAVSGGVSRLSSGRYTYNYFTSTSNSADGGVVLLNGLTPQSIKDMAGTYTFNPVNQNFYYLPTNLIGSDGRANPADIQPCSSPGQICQYVYLYGPWSYTTNMALRKQTRINERMSLLLSAEGSNVFNHPYFGYSFGNVTSTSFGTTTSIAGARSIQLRAEFIW
jgi:hypothetical protein